MENIQRKTPNYTFALIVVFAVLFLIGFITTMNNSMIDFCKKAFNLKEAFAKFRAKYVDVHPNCLNCASWSTQEKWDVIDVDMGKCHEVIE